MRDKGGEGVHIDDAFLIINQNTKLFLTSTMIIDNYAIQLMHLDSKSPLKLIWSAPDLIHHLPSMLLTSLNKEKKREPSIKMNIIRIEKGMLL